MEVYVVIKKHGFYGDPTITLFSSETSARDKFNEIAQDIKDNWGYDEYDPNDEYSPFDVSENSVSFYSKDENGCDDFYESVFIKKQEVL